LLIFRAGLSSQNVAVSMPWLELEDELPKVRPSIVAPYKLKIVRKAGCPIRCDVLATVVTVTPLRCFLCTSGGTTAACFGVIVARDWLPTVHAASLLTRLCVMDRRALGAYSRQCATARNMGQFQLLVSLNETTSSNRDVTLIKTLRFLGNKVATAARLQ